MQRTNIICISCPKGCRVKIEANENEIIDITGHDCPQGKEYAKKEYKNPTRILPTTMKVKNGELPLVPVKTKEPIPRGKIREAMQEIAQQQVEAPVKIGDILIPNIAGTGVEIVATRNVEAHYKTPRTA